MPTISPVLLLIIGLAAGILSGMFGIGGGVIIVPALILLGFTQLQANGTSLAVLILPVGLFAVINYYQAGKLKLYIAFLCAIGLMIGGFFGAKIALGIPATTLKQAYGVFLLYVAYRFADPRSWLAELRGQPAAPSPSENDDVKVVWYLILGVGLIAGVLSGMFGIGGGLIIVPALITLLHFDQKLAQGTSLGALLLPVGIGGLIEYANNGQLDINAALPVAIGLLFGAFAGSKIALNLPAKTIKRLYAIFVLILGVWFILQPILQPPTTS
ncbi:MAG: sulfite exporter TauE/SafE family protein [Burkholderiales bacterium]|nr:sulfite exporter TauE/SafE family protein [Anaerolineae bacterium]